MKRIKALIQKLQLKATWKSIVAFLALALSAVSAAKSSHIFPPSYDAALAIVSGAILAFERIAEAIENNTKQMFNSTFIHGESLTAASQPAELKITIVQSPPAQ